jgi:hypothetical protein
MRCLLATVLMLTLLVACNDGSTERSVVSSKTTMTTAESGETVPLSVEDVARRYGVSVEAAQRMLQFEDDPMSQAAEAVFVEFEPSVVTIEEEDGALVFYVSGDAARIEALALRVVGDPDRVSVRSGYLPRDEVAEAWELIESALLDHGLLGSGAIGPNEIVVFTPDPDEAREVVDALPIPPEIRLTYEVGSGVVDQ